MSRKNSSLSSWAHRSIPHRNGGAAIDHTQCLPPKEEPTPCETEIKIKQKSERLKYHKRRRPPPPSPSLPATPMNDLGGPTFMSHLLMIYRHKSSSLLQQAPLSEPKTQTKQAKAARIRCGPARQSAARPGMPLFGRMLNRFPSPPTQVLSVIQDRQEEQTDYPTQKRPSKRGPQQTQDNTPPPPRRATPNCPSDPPRKTKP